MALGADDRSTRRGLCAVMALALLLPAWVLPAGIYPAAAQDWPNRPVTLIVPYAAGGLMDTVGRYLGERMAKAFGQSFVIDNRLGAGGTLGTQYVARSQPDGYTLLVASVAQVTVAPLIQEVKYDSVRDFMPVSMFSNGIIVVAVNTASTARNVAELIAEAKSAPGKWAYSSAGFGTIAHLGGAMFASAAGVEMIHVPYKGAAPAAQALAAGEVQLFVGNLSELHAFIEAGKIRVLAVATPRRAESLPQVPTVAESLPGFQVAGWQGLLAPANTPKDIVARLEKEAIAAARDTAASARFRNMSINTVGSTSEEFAAAIKRDHALYQQGAQAAGLEKK
ncbi:MAG TPA: tripartite tricarboxylate transporter substrate binding protein [Xanthobacteraceae bacterium]